MKLRCLSVCLSCLSQKLQLLSTWKLTKLRWDNAVAYSIRKNFKNYCSFGYGRGKSEITITRIELHVIFFSFLIDNNVQNKLFFLGHSFPFSHFWLKWLYYMKNFIINKFRNFIKNPKCASITSTWSFFFKWRFVLCSLYL